MGKQNRYKSKVQQQAEINGQVIRGLSQKSADEFLAKAELAKAKGSKLRDVGGKYSAAMKAKGLIWISSWPLI